MYTTAADNFSEDELMERRGPVNGGEEDDDLDIEEDDLDIEEEEEEDDEPEDDE